MLTKQELRRYKYIKADIEHLKEQIQELRSLITVPKIQRLEGVPGAGSGEHDKLGMALSKIEKLESLYRQKIDELLELQLTIEAEIGKLGEQEQALIRLYYFRGRTWDETAAEMGYARRHITRLHGRALERLARI